MQILIEKVLGIIPEKTYFYIDEKSKHGFLIDPGYQAEQLLKIIKEEGFIIEKILLTHGHFDHIGAVKKISETLNLPYFIHENGMTYLNDVNFNMSTAFGEAIILTDAQYLQDGDVISLNNNKSVQLKVIHTPGHTSDSVIYYDEKEKLAFVGDTIFRNGIGRTDLPGASEQLLHDSIKNKIFTLPPETVLYSGHSSPTTVQEEMARY